jgi:N-acetyl-anhydromuramyl-L-alanine amidase AmpD
MIDKPLLDFAKRLMAYDGQDVRAVNAVEYMNSSPDHHHPDDPWRQRLMRGLQEGLRQLGYKVPRTGVADATTANALVAVAGRRWRWQSWHGLYSTLKTALRQ